MISVIEAVTVLGVWLRRTQATEIGPPIPPLGDAVRVRSVHAAVTVAPGDALTAVRTVGTLATVGELTFRDVVLPTVEVVSCDARMAVIFQG